MAELWEKSGDPFGKRSSEIIDLSLLQNRLEFLAEPERTWLELYWFRGCSPRELGEVCGASAARVRSRVRQLTGRILGPEYIRFVRGRLRFSSLQMAMAYDRYILGLGCRAIAKKREVTEWSVRCEVKRFQEWLKK